MRIDPARLLATYGTALGAALLFTVFAVFATNFLNPVNLLNILKQVSFLAILGLGFGLAFVTAELDLSFAAVCSFAAVVVGGLIHHGHHPALAVGAGLGVALAAGVLNGLLVTRLKIPSLIATLATASVATGLAFWVTGGVAFVGRWSPDFLALGRGTLFGVPALIVWTVGASLATLFVLKQTRLGMHLVFTGEADEAARLAGVNVRRMKVLGLALSGLAAGLVATLLTATLNSAAPNLADDYLLNAIAAVLLGMTMFEPGRCNVPGTLLSKMNYRGGILTERFEQNVASRIRGKVLDVVLSENKAVTLLGSHAMKRTKSWRDDVRQGMQALILQNMGKFQGIWASFDGEAYIIDDLLREQGMKKGDVVLVSVDGGQESYRRIKDPDSLFTATVSIPFEEIGRRAAESMDLIVAKKTPKEQVVSGPYLWMDAVLVDETNVDEFLAK